MVFQWRLEWGKYVTISTLDLIVDQAFSIVTDANQNFKLRTRVWYSSINIEKNTLMLCGPCFTFGLSMNNMECIR